MHTFTHFTRSSMTVILIHCIFLKKECTQQSDTTKNIWGGFQYNVPDPRTSECCNELGVCRCEFMLAPEYQELEFSKKLEAAALMFCWFWWLWGLGGPCESHTAGDCGELQAIGSLELGLWSGGSSPFFMIFFILERRFWNHIFTWGKRHDKQGTAIRYGFWLAWNNIHVGY